METLKDVADYLEGTWRNLESLLLDDDEDGEFENSMDAYETREHMTALRRAASIVKAHVG